jgi:hypothetical protein
MERIAATYEAERAKWAAGMVPAWADLPVRRALF